MKKRLLLGLLLVAGLAGCANLPQHIRSEGTRVAVPPAGEHWGSQAFIHNGAKKNIVIVPMNRGKGYPAEYELGKRSSWCFGLCRKRKVTKVFALGHGETIAVPLIANTASYYQRKMTLEVAVTENGKFLGKYFFCLGVPIRAVVTEYVIFGKQELADLRNRNSGYPCRNDSLWY